MDKTAAAYDQFCPVAVSLDILGDRWSLLLLRDLLWAGPQHRHDLIERNPGIEGETLDAVLASLTAHDLIHRIDEPKQRFSLTSRGEGISGVIAALFQFGLPMLGESEVNDWMLSYAVADAARRRRLDLIDVEERSVLGLRVDRADLLVELAPGVLKVIETGEPMASIRMSGADLAALVAGERTADDMLATGDLSIDGDAARGRTLIDLLPAVHDDPETT